MTWHIRVLAGSLSPTAGSHIYNRELIRRLCERGHRVSVVCLDDGGDDWRPAAVTVLPAYDWSALPAAWRFAVPLQATLSNVQLATASLDRPDIAICTEHFFLRPHARRFRGTAWLYLPHSLVVSHEIDSYGLKGMQRRAARDFYVRSQKWALRHASAVVRFNRAAAAALNDYYGAAFIRSPMLINPPGIELGIQTAVRRSKESTEPLRMLFVGRIVPSKNLEFILRSLALHCDAAWSLDIVGDGLERAHCESISESLGLADKVRFHGHQTDLAPWYSRADLLVSPSKLESMGLAVLEAMGRGVPALVIRASAVDAGTILEGSAGGGYRVPFSEVIDDGVDGLLAVDEDDFRRRVADSIADPSSVRRLSAAARSRVLDCYHWERHLDRYEAVFDQLIGSRKGPRPMASRALS